MSTSKFKYQQQWINKWGYLRHSHLWRGFYSWSLKRQLSRIVNLCQVLRDWVHHSCDASVMDTNFPSAKKRNIRSKCKQSDCVFIYICKQPDCVSIYKCTQTDRVYIIGSDVLKRHYHYLATLSYGQPVDSMYTM